VFVPVDFVVPLRLETPQFRLEPLGPEHNDADYRAWSSSMEHIHATPGWEKSFLAARDDPGGEPGRPATACGRLREPPGFTYTVLEPGGDVVGCVYIYPPRMTATTCRWSHGSSEPRRPRRAPLAGGQRLACTEWPFEKVDYAARKVPERDWSQV
jgi:hypothetical protein